MSEKTQENLNLENEASAKTEAHTENNENKAVAQSEANAVNLASASNLENKANTAQESTNQTNLATSLTPPNHKWYAIQTYAGSEMAVKRGIENLVKDNALEAQVSQIIVPTEDVIEFKNGKEKITERSLYSGYVFVCLEFSIELWHKIQSLPKVGRFIGESKTGERKQPTPLNEKDIRLILEKVQNKAAPKPKISFEKDENVRIVEGPFANFTGVVEEYDPVRGLLKLNVSIFGRSTPVEILYSQIEKII